MIDKSISAGAIYSRCRWSCRGHKSIASSTERLEFAAAADPTARNHQFAGLGQD
jgi:hypothetical protein